MRSFPALRVAAVALWLAVPAAGDNRVIFITLDGFGYQALREDPAAAEVQTLRRMAAQGVSARGLVSAFPSLTAPAHAAIYTGTYGNANGIAGNNNAALPRAAHTFLERTNGFRAEQQSSEPIWVGAARQGVRTVAHQVTQAIPFGSVNTARGAVVVNTYQSETLAPDAVLRGKDVTPEPAEAWPLMRKVDRAFRWTSGKLTFHAAIVGGVMHISTDPAKGVRVTVAPAPAETEPPRQRLLARHFSAPLPAPAGNERGAAWFRLFELRADGSDFLLYQSPVKQLAMHGAAPEVREALLAEAGGMVGNGPSRAYETGRFGEPGKGLAERRYLECLELSVRQFNRYSEWLWRKFQPRLLVDYASIPDEFQHAWLGMSRYQGRMDEWRRWGFVLVERRLEAVAALAGAGDHVVVASDHGMGAFEKEVRVNAALARAGLEGKAVHLAYSVLLNTTDWKGGVVRPDERAAVLAQVERALREVRDPETDRTVFTRFYRPGEAGAHPGIGGPAGGDLYFDLAPGYLASHGGERPVVARLREPVGAHGPDPSRADMLGIFVGQGPKFPRGREWGRMMSIDAAAVVAELLGIQAPKGAKGKGMAGR